MSMSLGKTSPSEVSFELEMENYQRMNFRYQEGENSRVSDQQRTKLVCQELFKHIGWKEPMYLISVMC